MFLLSQKVVGDIGDQDYYQQLQKAEFELQFNFETTDLKVRNNSNN